MLACTALKCNTVPNGAFFSGKTAGLHSYINYAQLTVVDYKILPLFSGKYSTFYLTAHTYIFFCILLSSQNKLETVLKQTQPQGRQPLIWRLLIGTLSDGSCYFNHAATMSPVSISKSLNSQTEMRFQNTIFNLFALDINYPSLWFEQVLRQNK